MCVWWLGWSVYLIGFGNQPVRLVGAHSQVGLDDRSMSSESVSSPPLILLPFPAVLPVHHEWSSFVLPCLSCHDVLAFKPAVCGMNPPNHMPD